MAVPQRSLVLFASRRTSAPPRPGVGHPVAPAGTFAEETTGSPKFLGNPHCRLPCSVDAGRTADTRPVRCSSVAPGMGKAEAPTKGLSTLNSMAFGLAAYASPGGLPHHDARLASSRWSDATGRAFTRRAPMKGFRVLDYNSSPFPELCLAQSHRPLALAVPGCL